MAIFYKKLSVALLLLGAGLVLQACTKQSETSRQGAIGFEPVEIAADVEGAYLTQIADLNMDGRPDVIVLSIRSNEVFWFENPTWMRHVLARDISPAAVGAAVDEHSDALKIVLLTGFHRDSYAANKGELVMLHPNKDGFEQSLLAIEPAAHRAGFGDIDGDGLREMVVAPIAGPGEDAPIASLSDTPLVYFNLPDSERHIISNTLKGTVHGLALVDWDGDGKDEIITAGLGGVWLHQMTIKEASGEQWSSRQLTRGRQSDDPYQRGAGDIGVGRLGDGSRFLATIESVHGGEVAVYIENADGEWVRKLIDEGFALAHGFSVADFDGDGADEIIVSDSRGDGGVFLYEATDDQGLSWQRTLVDELGMAAGACQAADMTNDGLIDIVCAGFQTRNAKLYVNKGRSE